jgi:hypothetical protein
MEVCVPHSSTKTRRSGSTCSAPLGQHALSSSRSEAGSVFFERQTEPTEGAAHGGRRDSDPFRIFERLAMLLEVRSGLASAWSGSRTWSIRPFLAGGPDTGPWAPRRRSRGATSGSAS